MSKRRASSCSCASQAGVGVVEVGVAATRDRQALAQRGADVEHARAVGSAQPLLPGAGVGVAAERVDVDRHRADALGAVEQHRHVELGELRRREQPAHPADVRAGDQSRARADRVGELAERHFADLDAAQLARGAERAEQPGVLLVAGQDLIAGAELEPADHLRHAFARAGRQRDIGRRRSRARARRPRAAGRSARVRRSKCADARPSLRLALQLRGGGRDRARGQRAVGARRSGRRARAGRETRRAARRGPRTARIPACPAHRAAAACGSRPSRTRARRDDALHALGRRARGARLRDYEELWRWSVRRARGVLGEHLGVLRRARVATLRARARLARDARRALVRGRRAQLRREHARRCSASRRPAGRRRDRRACTPRSCASSASSPGASSRSAVAQAAGGLRALGVQRGDRVVAYMPNIPETLIAFLAVGEHRRDLVERRAGVRRAQRDRPLRADRAEGAARGRRLPPRRQGLRPHGRRRGDPRGAAERRAHVVLLVPTLERRRPPRLDGAHSRWSELLARGEGAELQLRAGALRPPAVGALLLGHDRPAEGDRAGPRRDPARAAQEAPAPRPARRATACSGSRRPAG